MSDLISFYLSNKSKLIDLGIEILYAFTLLFFAGQIYGQNISFDALISEAKSVSPDFFRYIIGISLSYFLVVIVARIVSVGVMNLSEKTINYFRYLRQRKKIPSYQGKTIGFKTFKQQDEIESLYIWATSDMFVELEESQFHRFRSYFLKREATLLLKRIFIILSAYLIIRLGFDEGIHIGVIDCFIIPGLIVPIVLHFFAAKVETAVSSPSFFKRVEQQKKVRELRSLVRRNKYCHQKIGRKEKDSIKEDVFFIHNEKGRVIGWLIVVSNELMDSSVLKTMLETKNAEKGSLKILIDPFDLIPDRYLEQINIRLIKNIENLNVDKEVNRLLMDQKEKDQ